jgi:hypothetical protein
MSVFTSCWRALRGRAGLIALIAMAEAVAAEDGFVRYLDGDSLAGWVNVNGAPETWSVRGGVVSCTGKGVAALRTERQWENFIMEVEWRHLEPGGNAGIFVWASSLAAPGVPFLRAIEVQVLDNGYAAKGKNEWYTTHGDIFPIHGSTMIPLGRISGSRSFPAEERSKPSPEWNHYRLEAREGVLELAVNGKLTTRGEKCFWRKGYLGLESEGSPTEWRNLRIKELPSTGAAASESAPVDAGWAPLYNGVDLRGWTQAPADGGWKPEDWMLVGKGAGSLVSEWQGGRELIMDVRWPVGDGAKVLVGGSDVLASLAPAKGWNRYFLKAKDAGWEVTLGERTAMLPVSSGSEKSSSLVLVGQVVVANFYGRK